MNRLVPATAAVAAALLIAACGTSTAAGPAASGSSSSSTGGGRGLGRNGTAGELVKITGSTLILSTQQGDVTVDAGNATVQKASAGTVADIVQGSCVIIAGRKDSTGAITATNVRLSQPVNGACTGPGGDNGGPGGFGGAPRRTPNPGAPDFAGVRGQVTAVNGTQVTVQPPTGAAQTVTVPTTVQVGHSQAATLSDLNVGDCVLAVGAKNSAGVVAARSVQVVPAGPSGCFTGGGFGRGGGFFGGGGGGGGGSGGGGGAAGSGSATAD